MPWAVRENRRSHESRATGQAPHIGTCFCCRTIGRGPEYRRLMDQPIPERVRRFVLTSIPSVPHLETLLLLWRSPETVWTVELIASRLYVQPTAAGSIAEDLMRADLLESVGPARFRSRRGDAVLAPLIAEVEMVYSRQLRAISELIHSNVDRKAANFAQAFSWWKS